MRTKNITLIAMFAAIAYAIMFVGRIPISTVEFLKYDPKDIIIVICGFVTGPLNAFLVSVIVSLVEMVTVSTTGFWGLFMNILSTCSFACTAAYVYKKVHTLTGAVAGLAGGCLVMAVVMLAWNYLITPIYMGAPREQIAAMLVPVFLPFNALKGTINAALTLMVYKPVSKALFKSGMIKTETFYIKGKFNPAVTVVSLMLLITAVFIILAMKGII